MGWRSITFFVLFMSGCMQFEYSPNQIFDNDTPRDLNSKNLQKLKNQLPGDTTMLVLIGDSQRFYDEVQLFVDKVNTMPSVDFVLLAGDITDFGLLKEFKLVAAALDKLNPPYIAVVGNHDVIGNGEEVYKQVYGPLDFSFVYNKIRYVIHNTNGREYISKPVPDLGWLEQQLNLKDEAQYVIGVSHVPPYDHDFDSTLVDGYKGLLQRTPNLLVSLHGHIHSHQDGYPFEDGVRYITGHSFDKRSFVLLKIYKGNVYKEIIEY